MKKTFILLLFFFTSSFHLSAQEVNEQKYFIGGSYAFFITEVYPDGTSDSVSTHEHFIDFNFRYALNRVWRVGAAYTLTYMSNDQIDDPFSTFGISLDYDFLRAKRSKLHFRAGLSISNASFTANELPQKQFVFNRIFGGSYEYRISKAFWVYGGFYHHFPFTKIEFKDAMVQPCIGMYIGL